MIDSNYIKDKLTQEDIIKLCCALQGSDEYYFDNYGNPIFSTVLDHPDSSGSLKEYYFPETKLFHCFGGETLILTDNGTRMIKDLVDKRTNIINGNHEWETVEFKDYGKQRLMKITLKLHQRTKEIYATPEHEWIIKRKLHKVMTKDLCPGVYLEKSRIHCPDIPLDPRGIIHGIVYGDGSILYTYKDGSYSTRFIAFNTVKEEVLKYFHDCDDGGFLFNTTKYDYSRMTRSVFDKVEYFPSVIFKTSVNMKEVPSLNNSLSYLLGFLAGYFAMDGNHYKSRLSICSYKKDDIYKIRDIATKCGIMTLPISELFVKSGKRGCLEINSDRYQYILRIVGESLNKNFFITSKGSDYAGTKSNSRWRVEKVEETDRYENVYCCQTSTHSFVLDDFILTGNCFTRGESYDVFEMVRRAKGLETFKEAFDFIVDFFHFKKVGFEEDEEFELTSDWDIFQKVKDYSVEPTKLEENKIIQENMLEYFYPLAAPTEWLKEGISADVMRYYGIRVDSALHHIIIPHRDKDGNLIGIRRRSFDPIEVAAGKKYMPVFIQGKMYNHPLGQNLFGFYDNKDVIQRIKKVCIFEAEKSVMQIATMYGINECFAVATCGSSLSMTQINMLLDLGVTEIILAFDADHTGKRGDPDTIEYEAKLLKLVEPWLPYVNVSIIFDYDHILPHKASPSDCGRDTFEELYHKRIKLLCYNEKIRPIKKRR